MEKGLAYVFDKNTKVVIIGTFPSIKSRGECYYNHPQNQFWKIIAKICNDERVINGDKNVRYDCLRKNCIGLWDMIQSCDFEELSSLDEKIIIKSIKYNNFSTLKKECPNLKCIVFSSNNALKLYKRYLKKSIKEYPELAEKQYKNWLYQMTNNGKNVLPSTSPANARKKPEIKLREWADFFNKYL